MQREIIQPKIFNLVISNPKVKANYTSEQSVRNAISRIHKKNVGITMNAAAHELARMNGFGVWRYLSQEDRLSLQYLKPPIETKYPQLGQPRNKKPRVKDIKVDFKSAYLSEANENANAYPYIYILENSLRSIIFEKIGTGQDWWNDKQIVAEGIQNYAKRIQEAEKKHPWVKERGNHPLYYVGLNEMFKIIEKNWKSNFTDVFPDLELFRAWIKESVPIRNLVAHNVKTRSEERQNIRIKCDYICRLIEKWYERKSIVK